MANVTAGNRFEWEFADTLGGNGFWVLRIPQNAGGQQPADLIAVKGRYHALIDCKVVSGDRFAFDRIEDNQHYAMERFQAIAGEPGWIAIQLPDREVVMLRLHEADDLAAQGQKSLSVKDMKNGNRVWTLARWLERAADKCG